MSVTHFTINFRFRHQSRYGVNYNDIYCTTANKSFRNLKSLFSIIWLRNQQIIDIYPQVASIYRIHRMLRINKCCNATLFLSFCYSMKSYCCFTRRFWTVDFNYTTTREATYTNSNIDSKRTRGNHLYIHAICRFAKTHNSTFTKIFFNLF